MWTCITSPEVDHELEIRGREVPPSWTKAGEGTRTPNIQLGRLTLYQLSYAREGGHGIHCGTEFPYPVTPRHSFTRVPVTALFIAVQRS